MANQAEFYQDSIKRYENILRKSRTAYSPGAEPTRSDISAQIKLMGAQKGEAVAESEELKKRWYGERDAEDKLKEEPGYFKRVLKGLATPGYTITGAIESLLGKGIKKGVLKNIKANIEEGGTMGDLIRSYGINNLVAMPLGFALDVATDPVNWATAGGASLVGGALRGGAKAGLTGVKASVEKNLLGKAKFIGGLTLKKAPVTVERAVTAPLEKELVKPSRWRNLYEKISKKADDAQVEYERLTGDTIEKALSESSTKRDFFDRVSDRMNKSVFWTGINKFLKYSSQEATSAKIAAADLKAAEAAKSAAPLAKSMKKRADIFTLESPVARAVNSKDLSVKLAYEKERMDETARLLGEEISNIKRLLKDPDILKKIEGMTQSELDEIAGLFRYYKSETDLYDKWLAKKILNNPRGRKALEIYGIYTGLFKVMKIGGNLLASLPRALVGNQFMFGMNGGDILNSNNYAAAKKAVKILVAKDAESLAPLLKKPEWVAVMKKYPDLFEETYGLNADLLLNGHQYINNVVNQLMRGKNLKRGAADVEEIKRMYDDAFKVVNLARPATRETAYLATEVMRGPYRDFIERVRIAGEKGSIAAKLFYKFSEKSMDIYAKADQVARLSTALRVSEYGVSGLELRKFAQRIRISMSDVEKIGADLYRIKPLRATELANEIYLNYLAMPPFVRIMRTLPLAGFPFVSFSYGMTALTAKTALYNTSFFNKVQYLLHEITGEKTPLEKEALAGPYYNWMDRPGMVKIPFFGENPLYLDASALIPYYTMNLLNPSQRNYKERFGGVVSNIIDKSPFFKTPDGQMMLDYLILPTILQKESPQGAFGQKLFPEGAAMTEKLGSLTRSGLETVMPPMAGLLGAVTPESLLPYMPVYRWRKLGYAVRGKTAIGAQTKEPGSSRGLRELAGMAAFPVYPISLQQQVKNKTKK